MAKRKRKIFKESKYAQDAQLFQTKILNFEERNVVYPSGTIKNVFYCESKVNPKGIMCIYWSVCYANNGDSVVMKGRMKDGTFLVWSMMIAKKGEQNEKRQDDNAC